MIRSSLELKIVSGSAHPRLAADICAYLGVLPLRRDGQFVS